MLGGISPFKDHTQDRGGMGTGVSQRLVPSTHQSLQGRGSPLTQARAYAGIERKQKG